MKNKRKRKKLYSKLMHRIFIQTILILVLAIITVVAVRFIGRGYIGNAMVDFMTDKLNITYDTAYDIYHVYIRKNIENMMIATAIIFFIVFFRISIRWFMNYFDYIIDGVDKLTDDMEDPIEMPDELGFMEEKLNQVKRRLVDQKDAMQKAEQRKNDLVVYLAHDIKTPLTSVIGYLSLMDEMPEMPPEQKAKYLHITLDKALRLESLINEFFDIVKYSMQEIKLEKQQIDLYYMLIQLTDEFSPMLEPDNKKTVLHADENITVYADPGKLARVFNNIMKNAIAYSESGSKIDVYAKEENGMVTIRFVNEGSTIPQEKLEIIFQKFFRLDEARSTYKGGAGLGLAIAKEIVSLHGGTISANSQEGKTEFMVSLPNGNGSNAK